MDVTGLPFCVDRREQVPKTGEVESVFFLRSYGWKNPGI